MAISRLENTTVAETFYLLFIYLFIYFSRNILNKRMNSPKNELTLKKYILGNVLKLEALDWK